MRKGSSIGNMQQFTCLVIKLSFTLHDGIHPTGRHWFDEFPLQTLLTLQYESTEQKGDIHLKQVMMKRIVKQFFLARHVRYVRCITLHLMELLAHVKYKK